MQKILEPETWVEAAACRGSAVREASSKTYFPSRDNELPETAAQTCSRCPVTAECLDFALRNRIEDGIWGGKTVKERRKVVKRYRYSPPEESLLDEVLDFIS